MRCSQEMPRKPLLIKGRKLRRGEKARANFAIVGGILVFFT